MVDCRKELIQQILRPELQMAGIDPRIASEPLCVRHLFIHDHLYIIILIRQKSRHVLGRSLEPVGDGGPR